MLAEFQESSRELERALEEELQAEESRNKQLMLVINDKEAQILRERQKNKRLEAELVEVESKLAAQSKEHEAQLASLRQHLVSVEINNDYMESNDRVLSHKLELANQFNNELLEKMAIVENDLELERRTNLQNQLLMTNYQNEIALLKKKVKDDSDDEGDFESTFLSIKEVLRSGPPGVTVPRTTSLKKVHDLTTSFLQLNEKLQNWNNAVLKNPVKSPSTTHLTRATAEKRLALDSTHMRSKLAFERATVAKRTSSLDRRRLSASPLMMNLLEKIHEEPIVMARGVSLRESRTERGRTKLTPVKGLPEKPTETEHKKLTKVSEKLPERKPRLFRKKNS